MEAQNEILLGVDSFTFSGEFTGGETILSDEHDKFVWFPSAEYI